MWSSLSLNSIKASAERRLTAASELASHAAAAAQDVISVATVDEPGSESLAPPTAKGEASAETADSANPASHFSPDDEDSSDFVGFAPAVLPPKPPTVPTMLSRPVFDPNSAPSVATPVEASFDSSPPPPPPPSDAVTSAPTPQSLEDTAEPPPDDSFAFFSSVPPPPAPSPPTTLSRPPYTLETSQLDDTSMKPESPSAASASPPPPASSSTVEPADTPPSFLGGVAPPPPPPPAPVAPTRLSRPSFFDSSEPVDSEAASNARDVDQGDPGAPPPPPPTDDELPPVQLMHQTDSRRALVENRQRAAPEAGDIAVGAAIGDQFAESDENRASSQGPRIPAGEALAGEALAGEAPAGEAPAGESVVDDSLDAFSSLSPKTPAVGDDPFAAFAPPTPTLDDKGAEQFSALGTDTTAAGQGFPENSEENSKGVDFAPASQQSDNDPFAAFQPTSPGPSPEIGSFDGIGTVETEAHAHPSPDNNNSPFESSEPAREVAASPSKFPPPSAPVVADGDTAFESTSKVAAETETGEANQESGEMSAFHSTANEATGDGAVFGDGGIFDAFAPSTPPVAADRDNATSDPFASIGAGSPRAGVGSGTAFEDWPTAPDAPGEQGLATATQARNTGSPSVDNSSGALKQSNSTSDAVPVAPDGFAEFSGIDTGGEPRPAGSSTDVRGAADAQNVSVDDWGANVECKVGEFPAMESERVLTQTSVSSETGRAVRAADIGGSDVAGEPAERGSLQVSEGDVAFGISGSGGVVSVDVTHPSPAGLSGSGNHDIRFTEVHAADMHDTRDQADLHAPYADDASTTAIDCQSPEGIGTRDSAGGPSACSFSVSGENARQTHRDAESSCFSSAGSGGNVFGVAGSDAAATRPETSDSFAIQQTSKLGGHMAAFPDSDVQCLSDKKDSSDIVSTLQAELARVRRERDGALAETGEVRVELELVTGRESSLREERDILQSRLIEVEGTQHSLKKAFDDALQKAEAESRANIAKFRAVVPEMGGGSETVGRSELVEACQRVDAETRRANMCQADAEALTVQVENLELTRNALLMEKEAWVKREFELTEEKEQKSSALSSAESRLNSMTGERDAARDRCDVLASQMKKLGAQLGMALQERDSLVKQRSSGPADIQALEADRERAYLTLSGVQKQLASAMAKVEKVSAQRRTFLNQRDDAGMRLRAAGAEFQVVQDKVQALSEAQIEASATESRLTRERDDLRKKLTHAEGALKVQEGLETEIDTLKAQISSRPCGVASEVASVSEDERIRIAELESALSFAKSQAAVASEEASNAASRCAQIQVDLSEKNEEILSLRDTAKRAESEVTELQERLRIAKEDALQDIRVADARVAEAERAYSLAMGESESLQGNLDASMALVDRSAESLWNTLSSLESSTSSRPCPPKTDLFSLVESVSTSLQQMASNEAALEARLYDSTNAMEAKTVEYDKSVADKRQLECELSLSVEELAKLRSSSVPSSEVQSLSHELSEASAELSKCRTELDDLWEIVQRFAPAEKGGGWMGLGLGKSEAERDVVSATKALVSSFESLQEAHRVKGEEMEANSTQLAENLRNISEKEAELEELRSKASDASERLGKERERLSAEIRAEFDETLGSLEDELRATQADAEAAESMRTHLEAECEELRSLNAKLTSQFNSRTNELDDTEEKVAYLQDQVATLEEELEEARSSSQSRAEESAELRRSDVQKVSEELKREQDRCEELEESLTQAQADLEVAEVSAREAKLLAETHRQAENNLQIAIEQFEAEKDAEIARQTAALQKDLERAREGDEDLADLKEKASHSKSRIEELSAEVLELRAALGRLADERVELKLELEEKLSRLNHPDAGGQLVDRRVVRQLLVSYFRVDSLRRQDVLQLMSRMLAFSDDDLIAVGIKRRRLIERLGSVVQAPHVEDGSPAPIGTVSEKWVEFLIRESGEQSEQEDF